MKKQMIILLTILSLLILVGASLFLVGGGPVVLDVGIHKTDFIGQSIMNIDDALVNDMDGSVEILFQNPLPYDIRLPLTGTIEPSGKTDCTNDGSITATYLLADGTFIQVEPTSKIPPGGVFTVRWDCQPTKSHKAGERFKAELGFDYVTTNNEMERVITGTVVAEYE